jgi:hypothetical protein
MQDSQAARNAAPDFAEPVIEPRFARTRWLHPGYACSSHGQIRAA